MRQLLICLTLVIGSLATPTFAETNSRVPDHLVQQRYDELRANMKKYPTNSTSWIKMNKELNDIRARLNGLQKKDAAALSIIRDAYRSPSVKKYGGRLLPAAAGVAITSAMAISGSNDAYAATTNNPRNSSYNSTVSKFAKTNPTKTDTKNWATPTDTSTSLVNRTQSQK